MEKIRVKGLRAKRLACAVLFALFALLLWLATAPAGSVSAEETGAVRYVYYIGDGSVTAGSLGAQPAYGDPDVYGYYVEFTRPETGVVTRRYSDLYAGWTAAMNAGANKSSRVSVRLLSDWIASGSFGSSNANLGPVAPFNNGALYVSSGVYAELDLNGHVLDLGLSSGSGLAVYVENARLDIVDGDHNVVHQNLNTGADIYTYTARNVSGSGVTQTVTAINGGIIRGGTLGVRITEGALATGGLTLTDVSITGLTTTRSSLCQAVAEARTSTGVFELNNVLIAGNEVDQLHAVYMTGSANVKLNNVTVTDNDLFGALYLNGAFNADISDVSISFNNMTVGEDAYVAPRFVHMYNAGAGITSARGLHVDNNVMSYAALSSPNTNYYPVYIDGNTTVTGGSITGNEVCASYSMSDCYTGFVCIAGGVELDDVDIADNELIHRATGTGIAEQSAYAYALYVTEGENTIKGTAQQPASISNTYTISIAAENGDIAKRSLFGGGVYVAGGKLVAENVDIDLEYSDGNTVEVAGGTKTIASAYGGRLLCVAGGELTLSGASSVKNVVSAQRDQLAGEPQITSAVCVVSGGLVIDGAQISGCSTDGDGGAIYACAGSKVTVLSGAVKNNTATGNGGAIAAESVELCIVNGELSGNTATGNGGAIYTAGGAELAVYAGKLTGNSAANGGCIYVGGEGNTLVLGSELAAKDACEISGNTATGNGGGVYLSNTGDDGVTDKQCRAVNVTVENNAAAIGAGMYVVGAALELDGVELTQNNALTSGGGLALYATDTNKIRITNVTVSDNTAPAGAGVYADGAELDITSLTVTGNIAAATASVATPGNGAGLYAASSRLTAASIRIENNTVRGATPGENPMIAGAYLGGTTSLSLSGSPVIFNNICEFSDESTVAADLYYTSNVTISVTGKLNSARIGVYNTTVTVVGYSTHNPGENPANYFVHRAGDAYTFVATGDRLDRVENAKVLKLKVGESAVFGGSYTYTGSAFAYSFVTAAGQAATVDSAKVSVTRNGSAHTGDIVNAGTYVISVQETADTYSATSFVLEISAVDISDLNVSIVCESYEFTYSNSEKELSVISVTLGSTTITANSSEPVYYTIDYTDNKRVGLAMATFTFHGNYVGTKGVAFTIKASTDSYTVTWQYYNGTTWANVTDAVDFNYIPGGADQADRIRARLFNSNGAGVETVKYAYVDGVTNYHATGIEVSRYVVKITAGDKPATFAEAGSYEFTLYSSEQVEFNVPDGYKSVSMTMKAFALAEANVTAGFVGGEPNVVYDGTAKKPEVYVAYNSILMLTEGVDYTVAYTDGKSGSGAVEGGRAKAVVSFKGNYSCNSIELFFNIQKASNAWAVEPSIVRWSYGGFDADRTVIIGAAEHMTEGAVLHASLRDEEGSAITVGDVSLENIALAVKQDDTYGRCYAVDDADVVAALKLLAVDRYTLVVWVESTDSYEGVAETDFNFSILKADNYWQSSPGIASWTSGKYDPEQNTPVALSRFGTAHIMVTDTLGEVVYYDSAAGIDKLGSLSAGTYILTAGVDGTANYSELNLARPVFFKVFEPDTVVTGLPWWAVLLIVVGALALAALVLFILWKNGVFTILTDKMVLAIRTRATVDATIASVRAAKRKEEAQKSIAAAKAREEAEERERSQKQAEANAQAEKTEEPEQPAEQPAPEPEQPAEQPAPEPVEKAEEQAEQPAEKAEEQAEKKEQKTEKPAKQPTKSGSKGSSSNKKNNKRR